MSSSCQCLTTLYGMQKETKNNVHTIHRQLQKYARKFPRGHWSFWSVDQKRNGTELKITNEMDPGTKLQRTR